MSTYTKDKTYLRSDINRVLRSLGKSNARLASIINSDEAEIFNQGYISALLAVAEAFGIEAVAELQFRPNEFIQRSHLNSLPRQKQNINY